MSVNETVPARNDATSSGGTDYQFTFAVYAENDLAVYLDGSLQTINSHYRVRNGSNPFTSLTAAQLPSAGFIQFLDGAGAVTALASGRTVSILRDQPFQQLSIYTANEGFPASRVSKDYDKIVMLAQQIEEVLRRTVRAPVRDLLDMTLPSSATRANNVLGFTSQGLPTAVPLPTAGGGDVSLGTVLATSSTTARTLAERFAEQFHVKDYGAVGDGVTNDATAIQAAITAAVAAGEGSTVVFGPEVYLIGATLTVTSGIWLIGAHGMANAVNGSPTAMQTRILWDSGVAGASMLKWEAGTAAAIVRGGALGITLDGNNTATNGLEINSCAYSEFDVVTYRTVNNGCKITDSNSTLTNGIRFRRYEHFCGSNAAAHSSNGMFIDGDVDGLFATSIQCDWFECEIVNGHGLTFRAVDSCDFQRAKIYTRGGSGGTGYHVRFLKTANFPTFYAQKNRIGQLIGGGRIYYGDKCKNNIIDCCIAESGEITYESDAADKRTNHITRLLDFRNGGSWATHQFKLNDYRQIPLGDFVGYGTPATLTTVAATGAGRAWAFGAAATEGISYSNIVPIDWNAGYIRGVRLLVASVGATTGDAVIYVQCLAQGNTSAIGTFTQTVQATITPAQSVTNTLTLHELLFSSEEACHLEGLMCLTIERLGADGSDTYVNAIHVLGVEIVYRALGPASAGTYGPYGRTLIGGSDSNP